MVDIVMNSMQTLQYELGNFKAIFADVRINPDLSALPWLALHEPQHDIDHGSDAAAHALAVIEDADLLVIRRDTFEMMMQDDIDIVFRMLSDMGVRLARTDERFQALMLRVRRIRILGGCLRRISAGGETPAVLDVERLAEELQVAPPEVHATLAELAAQGAGTLRDGQFVIQDREHVTRLTEALCRLAEET